MPEITRSRFLPYLRPVDQQVAMLAAPVLDAGDVPLLEQQLGDARLHVRSGDLDLGVVCLVRIADAGQHRAMGSVIDISRRPPYPARLGHAWNDALVARLRAGRCDTGRTDGSNRAHDRSACTGGIRGCCTAACGRPSQPRCLGHVLTPSFHEGACPALTNLETAQEKLLQILLVGQPELDEKLDSVELRQLKQRIALRSQLEPLSLEETRGYIQRRLQLAGATSNVTTLFPSETIAKVYRHSRGIPRLINTVCENALITAFARQDAGGRARRRR